MKFIPKSKIELQQMKLNLAEARKIISDNNFVQYDENADHSDFNLACDLFKSVCAQIQELTGEQFRGGYDEILNFMNSDLSKTDGAKDIGLRLTFADLACNHEAKKIGLSSPQWWYKCWNIENNTEVK